MSVTSHVRLLQAVPIFANVNSAHLQTLVFSSRKTQTKAGNFIIKKGGDKNTGYLIVSGRAVARHDNKSSSPAFARLETGAFFGDTAMIAGLAYSISVQAVDDVQCLAISQKTFSRVCREFPEVAKEVLAVLSEKLDKSLGGFADVKNIFDEARQFTTR